jgi:hypothetical protein
VGGEENQVLERGTAASFDLSEVIAAMQATEFSVKNHGGEDPLY